MRQEFIDSCQQAIKEDLERQTLWLTQHSSPASLVAPTIGMEKGDHFAALAVARQNCRTVSVSIANNRAALGRIHNGTYGICVDCQQEIPEERLTCIPDASRCVPCQEKKGIKIR